MRIIADDLFPQRRYSGLQCVAAFLLLNYANGFTRDDFRRRQIRFTQAETDAAGLRAIRNLSDHALLNTAEKWWRLEGVQRSASSNCVEASVFSSRYFTITGA